MYDRHCLGLSESEVQEKIESGIPYTIRMLVPDPGSALAQKVGNLKQMDDQVLLKSDGYPTYHMANIVDDYTMKISHVIRGQEWLPSTPKHLLLYHMLDIDPPEFIHIPLLINDKGAKLSKRHGDFSVESFIKRGYLPEALINGVSLLGWNPPSYEDPIYLGGNIKQFLESEIMFMDDLEEYFDLNKIGKAPCKFEESKFVFLNSHHIRKKFEYYNADERKESTVRFRKILTEVLDGRPPAELDIDNLSTPGIEKEHTKEKAKTHSEAVQNMLKMDYKRIAKIMDLMIPRINFYKDMANHKYFFTDPDFSTDLASGFKKSVITDIEKSITTLTDLYNRLTLIQEDDWKKDDVNKECSMYLYEQNQQGIFSFCFLIDK